MNRFLKVTTVLNFAPALTEYTRDVFDCVDYLILNEVEIEQLIHDSYYSFSFKEGNEDDIKRACNGLLEKHPSLGCVIVTLGDKGVIYSDRLSATKPVHMGCEKVNVVDSTVWKILLFLPFLFPPRFLILDR